MSKIDQDWFSSADYVKAVMDWAATGALGKFEDSQYFRDARLAYRARSNNEV